MCFKTVRIAYNFIISFKKNDEILRQNVEQNKTVEVRDDLLHVTKQEYDSSDEYIQIIHVDEHGELTTRENNPNQQESDIYLAANDEQQCYEYVNRDEEQETVENDGEIVTEIEFEDGVVTYEVESQEMQDDQLVEYHGDDDEGADEQQLEEIQIRTEHNYDYKVIADKNTDESTEMKDYVLTESGTNKKCHCCPLCEKLCVKWQAFERHVIDHKEKSFDCLICGEKFNSAYIYLDHYKLVHMLQCRLCMKSFKAKSTFHYHMKQHHSKLITRYLCKGPNCNKVFHTKQSLKRHQSEHMEGFKYQCKDCNITFKGYDKYRYHIQSIHEGERRHLCTVCGRRFFQNTHLLDHMWLHTGEKRYKCKKCDKSYTSSSHLKKHVRRVCMPEPDTNI